MPTPPGWTQSLTLDRPGLFKPPEEHARGAFDPPRLPIPQLQPSEDKRSLKTHEHTKDQGQRASSTLSPIKGYANCVLNSPPAPKSAAADDPAQKPSKRATQSLPGRRVPAPGREPGIFTGNPGVQNSPGDSGKKRKEPLGKARARSCIEYLLTHRPEKSMSDVVGIDGDGDGDGDSDGEAARGLSLNLHTMRDRQTADTCDESHEGIPQVTCADALETVKDPEVKQRLRDEVRRLAATLRDGAMQGQPVSNEEKLSEIEAGVRRALDVVSRDAIVETDKKPGFWQKKRERLILDYEAYPNYHSFFWSKIQADMVLPKGDIYLVGALILMVF
jgi:hypothetical protein